MTDGEKAFSAGMVVVGFACFVVGVGILCGFVWSLVVGGAVLFLVGVCSG